MRLIDADAAEAEIEKLFYPAPNRDSILYNCGVNDAVNVIEDAETVDLEGLKLEENMQGQQYVVVTNTTKLDNGEAFTTMRHIIHLSSAPYDEELFKAWYYEEYWKLEGDKFIFCTTHAEMLSCCGRFSNYYCSRAEKKEDT